MCNRIEIVPFDNIQYTKAKRATRNGLGAPLEEREGDQGARGEGDGVN